MSPFASEAQRRKFAELVKQGKLKKEVFDEWNNATGHKKLPERITQKKEPGKKENHFDVIESVLKKK